MCDFSCPFRHDRNLAFYAEQDKKHEDERRLAAENQREWESRVAELERLLVESRTKCDEQAHLLAAACEERDKNAADSKAARADAAREHDARALAEHERDELAALLAKMREQLKTLQDQLHDVEAERDALRRECAGLNLRAVTNLLQGPVGSAFSLVIERKGAAVCVEGQRVKA